MQNITFTADEKSTVMQILEDYFSELRGEIEKTDNPQYRAQLKLKESFLKEALSKLKK